MTGPAWAVLVLFLACAGVSAALGVGIYRDARAIKEWRDDYCAELERAGEDESRVGPPPAAARCLP